MKASLIQKLGRSTLLFPQPFTSLGFSSYFNNPKVRTTLLLYPLLDAGNPYAMNYNAAVLLQSINAAHGSSPYYFIVCAGINIKFIIKTL